MRYVYGLLMIMGVSLPISAATLVGMGVDLTNSSGGGFGTNAGNVLNDTFAYDPDAPTSVNPDQTFGSGRSYHGVEPNGADIYLSYTFSQQIVDSTSSSIHYDIWGRLESSAYTGRDSDFDIVLYNGDYSTEIARIDGLDLVYADGSYLRATFTGLTAGTTFDRMQVIAHDSQSASPENNFTLQELRMATEGVTSIPEPSALALLTLGASCLLWRRRA